MHFVNGEKERERVLRKTINGWINDLEIYGFRKRKEKYYIGSLDIYWIGN